MTEVAERFSVLDILRDFSNHLGDVQAQYHIPASRDGVLQPESALVNYVFLASELDDNHLLRLERSYLVDSVLCIPGSVGRYRQVTKVSDQELSSLIEREPVAMDLKVGYRVSIDKGVWSGLYGVVVEIFGSKLKVFVELHSRARAVTLSRDEVTIIDHGDQP